MSQFRQHLHESPEYQVLTQAEQAAATTEAAHAATVGDAIAPVLDFEKGDIEFWAQIVQVFLLVLILHELRRGR